MAPSCAAPSHSRPSVRSRSCSRARPSPGTGASRRSSRSRRTPSGINESYLWVSIFTGAIFVLVQGSLIWFMIRYRRRRRDRSEDGAQVHGNTNLELAWTVAPVLILVAIGSFVFYKLPGIQDVPSASAEGGRVDVEVEGLPLLLELHVPERRDRRRHAARPGRPDGEAERLGARLRRDPLLVDPRARRQVRRDPRPGERDVVQRRGARDLPRPVRRVLRRSSTRR